MIGSRSAVARRAIAAVAEGRTVGHTARTSVPPRALARVARDYAGPLLRVRRSTDAAEFDVGFDAAGDLDRGALADFVTSNGANPEAEGTVVGWYDQSGERNDAVGADPGIVLYRAGAPISNGRRVMVAFEAGALAFERPFLATLSELTITKVQVPRGEPSIDDANNSFGPIAWADGQNDWWQMGYETMAFPDDVWSMRVVTPSRSMRVGATPATYARVAGATMVETLRQTIRSTELWSDGVAIELPLQFDCIPTDDLTPAAAAARPGADHRNALIGSGLFGEIIVYPVAVALAPTERAAVETSAAAHFGAGR